MQSDLGDDEDDTQLYSTVVVVVYRCTIISLYKYRLLKWDEMLRYRP